MIISMGLVQNRSYVAQILEIEEFEMERSHYFRISFYFSAIKDHKRYIFFPTTNDVNSPFMQLLIATGVYSLDSDESELELDDLPPVSE